MNCLRQSPFFRIRAGGAARAGAVSQEPPGRPVVKSQVQTNPISRGQGTDVELRNGRQRAPSRSGARNMTTRVQVVPKLRRRRQEPDPSLKSRPSFHRIRSHLTRPLSREHLLFDLPPHVRAGFHAIGVPVSFKKGTILFVEGQRPDGVYVLSSGRAKLSASSPDGKALLLRMAEPGEVIGLPGTISGKAYALTAEALEPLQAQFIARQPFLQFLCKHGEAALRVAEIMSDIYHATFQEVRYLGFSASAAEKLARLLLDFVASRPANESRLQAVFTFTHEEIAETIGTARETVTRILSDFRRARLIETRGPTLVIANRAGLEKLLSK